MYFGVSGKATRYYIILVIMMTSFSNVPKASESPKIHVFDYPTVMVLEGHPRSLISAIGTRVARMRLPIGHQ